MNERNTLLTSLLSVPAITTKKYTFNFPSERSKPVYVQFLTEIPQYLQDKLETEPNSKSADERFSENLSLRKPSKLSTELNHYEGLVLWCFIVYNDSHYQVASFDWKSLKLSLNMWIFFSTRMYTKSQKFWGRSQVLYESVHLLSGLP